MKKFTDLLDNYILMLGIHNQVHSLYEADPLRFGDKFREASEALQKAKDDLDGFFDHILESLAGVTTP